MNELSYEAKVVLDYMNQYISSDNVNCAEKILELRFNSQLDNKLDDEQWGFLIDYVYKDLLAHSMDDGIISDIERIELAKLNNLKFEFKNTSKEAIKFRLSNSVQNVEKSHNYHDNKSIYTAPKPTPWDKKDNT